MPDGPAPRPRPPRFRSAASRLPPHQRWRLAMTEDAKRFIREDVATFLAQRGAAALTPRAIRRLLAPYRCPHREAWEAVIDAVGPLPPALIPLWLSGRTTTVAAETSVDRALGSPAAFATALAWWTDRLHALVTTGDPAQPHATAGLGDTLWYLRFLIDVGRVPADHGLWALLETVMRFDADGHTSTAALVVRRPGLDEASLLALCARHGGFVPFATAALMAPAATPAVWRHLLAEHPPQAYLTAGVLSALACRDAAWSDPWVAACLLDVAASPSLRPSLRAVAFLATMATNSPADRRVPALVRALDLLAALREGAGRRYETPVRAWDSLLATIRHLPVEDLTPEAWAPLLGYPEADVREAALLRLPAIGVPTPWRRGLSRQRSWID